MLLNVRKAYLNKLHKVSDGKPYVTDKMPQNFLHIGIIAQALPEAKIIHVKRDPAATCWSNFKHYFDGNGLGYSYKLSDTVFYFEMYRELMSIWEKHYKGKIFNIDYDRLTIFQEYETKNLIAYLELDWEDACLSPEKNKRSVRTASQQQVREKIYTGSSQDWLKYQKFIGTVFASICR